MSTLTAILPSLSSFLLRIVVKASSQLSIPNSCVIILPKCGRRPSSTRRIASGKLMIANKEDRLVINQNQSISLKLRVTIATQSEQIDFLQAGHGERCRDEVRSAANKNDSATRTERVDGELHTRPRTGTFQGNIGSTAKELVHLSGVFLLSHTLFN